MTLLHSLGIDHEHPTVRVQWRDQRLKDVHGQAVRGIRSWVGWGAPWGAPLVTSPKIS